MGGESCICEESPCIYHPRYNRSLPAEELNAVILYLSTKWKIKWLGDSPDSPVDEPAAMDEPMSMDVLIKDLKGCDTDALEALAAKLAAVRRCRSCHANVRCPPPTISYYYHHTP